MRLYTFLNEENRVETEISKEEFYKLLRENCKSNLTYMKNSKKFIFRGIESAYSYLKFNGDKKRKSAYTSNYYTILFSEILKSWKDVPKRNKSLICTTDEINAEEYGISYLVIPYDKTKIATCNINDFWHILRNSTILNKMGISRLPALNDYFERTQIKETKTEISKFLSKKVVDLPQTLNEYNFFRYLALYTIKSNPNSFEPFKENYVDLIEKNKDKLKNLKIYDVLEFILNPKSLNISVFDSFSSSNIYSYSEVWMDQPALLINGLRRNEINEFLKTF